MSFVTRFAPSPTGPLHLGHAYSAMLAHDMARAAGGTFLLRIEDTDTDRARACWEARILDDLHWLGLHWPTPVLRQSDRTDLYHDTLAGLAREGLVFPCSCTRGDIRAALSAPQEGVAPPPPYPGTCRHRPMATRQPGDALRLNLAAALRRVALPLRYVETGTARPGTKAVTAEMLQREAGDAVLARRQTETVSYVLASVVDDAAQGISHVVRGEDLIAITAVQVLLQALLGLPRPVYHHHRLIRDGAGKRLAKRDDARAIAKYRADGLAPDQIRAMVGL